MTCSHVFKPIQLRHKTLRNRVVFGAHTTNMAEQGLPAERHLGYYVERAKGGAAMLVIEPTPPHAAAVLTRGNFRHGSDDVIPHFRRITDAVHDEGATILQQIYHVGAHGDADNSYHGHWSPSGGPSWHDSHASRAMNEAEIEETIESFVQAARRCRDAGFDGVEIWAAYHALPDQFWTPFSNTREDKWGGSLENRTRFSREILRRTRALCGEDFVIGLAISDEPDAPVALGREALAEIVALHDREELIDYVTCGTGSYFDFYKLMPTFIYGEKLGVDLATVIKGAVRHALVTAESHIRTPDNANEVLGSGAADLVSIVRGQIADPHLVNKARDGRADDIRGCISCNQMCWGRRGRDYWISCLVNPSVGREFEWGGDRFEPTRAPKRVLVVGGGPAGLEAARAAAERGHRVTLAEAGSELGGQFRLAGLQPRRAQILDLLEWYARQLEKLQVQIRYNAYLDAEDIAEIGADVVLLATGAQPDAAGFQRALPEFEALPGVDRPGVWSAEDVMARRAKLGKKALVLDEGGNWRGCGTAWRLAEAGHEVVIVTPDPLVGKELQRSAADWPLRRRLAELGVTFHTETAVREWVGDGARLVDLLTGAERVERAEALVIATTGRADRELPTALDAAGIGYTLIGDAAGPREAAYAFYEGRKAAIAI